MRRITSLLMILLLTALASAEPASFFIEKAKAFDSLLIGAKSWDVLYPSMTEASVEAVKAMTPERQAHHLEYQKTRSTDRKKLTTVTTQIGTDRTTVTFSKVETKKKGNVTERNSTESGVVLLKEQGAWKVEL